MNAKPITKSDYQEAAYAKQKISPVITELKKIDERAISGNSYTAKTISRAVLALEAHVKDADKLFAQVEADFQAAGGKDLVGKVASRVLAIPAEINLRQRTSELLLEAHDHRLSELKDSGFSEKQTAAIEPYPEQELADHAAAIESLKAEQSKLNQFLESAPVYELWHLDGTQFEGGLEKEEVAQ